jgi:Tfp pilus assembly protein PilP
MKSPSAAAMLVLLLLAAAALGQQPSSSGSQPVQGKAPNKGAAAATAPGARAATPTTPATPGTTAKGSKAAPGAQRSSAPPAASAPGAAPAAPGAPASPARPGAAGAPGAPPAIGSPPPDMGNIDQILEGDEEVLAGNTFTYDPGNRRDPFKSLLIAPDRPEFRGPRPEGVPGLLIDEIDLKGIFRTARGYVAQVNAANQKKSYLLKEGDQLYDGDVVSIGKSEVVFKQIVQDPTALKPFREIVKSLNPK